ncbi:PREDICTED: protein FAR1-RELATED SEQUENCE 1-like [Fragaria vesca subsp. vesca]|uniref:protein FAR1-RELATED SEQUENCE 1-like n=1 Tax=Fragaria vesca subsp. vesca TaxID=101020 RepID=UPI0002C30592|nr:PREDICTED: protein FAR1-RELATED SEQUENCE 1-like [Fragaria vesca subsp. vesca]
MVYASYTIDEWEEAWGDVVAKHGLEEDPWITALYEKRDRWAEAFFRGNFCAGMCSTQRLEGINGKIKTRVSRHTRLGEFLPRFHSGVCFLRNRYLLDDYKSKNHKRKFDSHLKSIEEDAFNTFTDDIFVVIKGQIMLENRFSVRSCVQFGGSGDLMFYLSQYERPNRSWTVLYSSVDGKYSCSCLQFESDGVPCAHLFCVLKYRNVSVYPKSLIEDRWTKGGGRLKMVPIVAECVDEKSGRILRYTALMCEAKKACHNLSQSTEGFDAGIVQLSGLTETSMKYREAKRSSVVEPVVHPVPDNVLKDPVIARTKGMHGNSVLAANAGNVNGGEGNRCRECGVPGHNKRRCPLVKYTNKGPGKCQKSSKKSKTAVSGKSTKPLRSDRSGKPSKSGETGTSENVGEHGYEENIPATSEFEGNEPNQSKNAYTTQRSPSDVVHTDTFVGDECHDNVNMADVNSQVGKSCQINE